jgi:hypothetical protein
MNVRLVDGMSIASSGTDYTRWMSMNGDNAVQVHALGENLNGAASWTIVLEGSNDGANPSTIVTWSSLAVGNNFPTKQTGIGFAMIRCKVTAVSGGPVIVTINVNTSHQ